MLTGRARTCMQQSVWLACSYELTFPLVTRNSARNHDIADAIEFLKSAVRCGQHFLREYRIHFQRFGTDHACAQTTHAARLLNLKLE
jgi:hypothetical protein